MTTKATTSSTLTTTASAHLPPLGTHARNEIGAQLQSALLDLVELSLVGKQLHWSIVGSGFTALHQQLDELVDSWRDLADVVAERAVAIGYWPDGQATALIARDGREPVTAGAIEDRDAVAELVHRLGEIGELMRQRMERLTELDLVSQDVLVGVVRALERQLWMLRAQMPRASDT